MSEKVKSNNPDASKKVKGHECGVGMGAHSSGKPVEPHEGPGWHCGRKTPKPEEVRELPLLNPDKKAVEVAEKQNTSSDGRINQQPSGKNFPSRVKPE